MAEHRHKVSKCEEFFALSPLDRWEQIAKGRMCFSCLKPKTICKSRKCTNYQNIPKVLKCAICASWAESKVLAQLSIFFCKQKEHGDSRAPLTEMKSALEKYIGKLGTAIADSNIQLDVNFMYQTNIIMDAPKKSMDSSHGMKIFPLAPAIDSETGHEVLCEEEDICSESSESSIYLMQNLRVGDSNCLTFFDSGANEHLIDGQLARQEELQLISSKSVALGVIAQSSIRTEY